MSLEFIDQEAQARYTERREVDLLRCRETLKNKDFTMCQTVGHNLKGNGISFGFPELSKLGAELEMSAKNHDFDQASQCLNSLESWILDHKGETSSLL